MKDIESEELTLVDAEGASPLPWQYTGRMQPSQWKAETEIPCEREKSRLIPLLGRGHVFASLAIGVPPCGYSGNAMKQWFRRQLTKINRLNQRRTMAAAGARLVLSASHITVAAGEGMLRPRRPNIHLLVALKTGKNIQKRVRQVQELLACITGCIVTSRQDDGHIKLVCDEEYLANTIDRAP